MESLQGTLFIPHANYVFSPVPNARCHLRYLGVKLDFTSRNGPFEAERNWNILTAHNLAKYVRCNYSFVPWVVGRVDMTQNNKTGILAQLRAAEGDIVANEIMFTSDRLEGGYYGLPFTVTQSLTILGARVPLNFSFKALRTLADDSVWALILFAMLSLAILNAILKSIRHATQLNTTSRAHIEDFWAIFLQQPFVGSPTLILVIWLWSAFFLRNTLTVNLKSALFQNNYETIESLEQLMTGGSFGTVKILMMRAAYAYLRCLKRNRNAYEHCEKVIER